MFKKIFLLIFIILPFLLFPCRKVFALPVGTLLYRTSSNGSMYGFSEDELARVKNGVIKNIYSGHVAIYVGKENGEDYIVEALAGGLQKTPAKYFIDKSQGEEFIGAKIPTKATYIEKYKAAQLALALAEHGFAYDLDFHSQKGPGEKEWTCVGLAEKVYESSNIFNPYRIDDLVYDQNNYGVDITPDGYDDYSIFNKRGDTFSKLYEFSLIEPYTEMFFPTPEIFGFDAGREHDGKRYFFLPYTQYLQKDLEEVDVDIQIASDFVEEGIRTDFSSLSVALKWGIINQPISVFKKVGNYVGEQIDIFLDSKKEKEIVNLSEIENNKSQDLEQELEEKIEVSVLEEISKIVQREDKEEYYIDNSLQEENNSEEKVEQFFVQKVLGGDSILLNTGEIIKYLGIETPSLKGFLVKEDECLSWVATKRNEELILGKEVFLEKDPNFNIDNRNRLLRYVYFKNNNDLSCVNEILLKDGLAFLEEIDLGNYKKKNNFLEINNEAKNNKLGLFSGVCDGLASMEESNIAKDKIKSLVSAFRQTEQEKIFNYNNLNKQSIFSNDNNEILDSNNEGDEIKAGDEDDNGDNGVLSVNERIADNILFKTLENDFVYIDENSSDNNIVEDQEDVLADEIVEDNIVDDVNNDEENNEDIEGDADIATSTEEVEIENECVDELVISRIYATGNNDWLEIFNPCDKVVDLGLEGIRLEKSKTTLDPSILLRFSDSEDFSLNTSLTINPNSYFLITNLEADEEIRNEADVISLRNEFTWRENGYSIYLARGPVSSNDDEDIIDLVGFGGDSLYFEGPLPAVEILDNSILIRKASETSTLETLKEGSEVNDYLSYDSNNNYFDFILWPLIIETNEEDENNADSNLFSDYMLNLWHFSECRLNTIYDDLDDSNFNNSLPWFWSVGKNTCSLTANYNNEALVLDLNDNFKSDDFKVFWQQRFNDDSSRVVLKFNGSDTDSLDIILGLNYMEIKTPNNYKQRFTDISCSKDNLWHDMVLSVDPDSLSLRIYEDQVLIHEQEINQRLVNFSRLEFSSENGYSSIDEVTVFDGLLSIDDLFNLTFPFEPNRINSSLETKVVKHFWNFNEGQGDTANDSVSGLVFDMTLNGWSNGREEFGLEQTSSNKEIFCNNLFLSSENIILDFWHQNSAFPDEGRGNIGLYKDDIELLGLIFSYYSSKIVFNNQKISLESYTIPNDDLWHHIVLSYDAFNYRLVLTVDDEEEFSQLFPWPLSIPETLKIKEENYYYRLDDIKIIQGNN